MLNNVQAFVLLLLGIIQNNFSLFYKLLQTFFKGHTFEFLLWSDKQVTIKKTLKTLFEVGVTSEFANPEDQDFVEGLFT